MERIIDNFIIFICCLLILFSFKINTTVLIGTGIAICCVCFSIYFKQFIIRLLIFLLFLLLSFLNSSLLFFIPVMCYSFLNTTYTFICTLAAFVLYIQHNKIHSLSIVFICLLFGIAYILKYRSDKYIEGNKHFEEIRQNLKNYNTNLNQKNIKLIEKHDYEIANAILVERNRIARDIHDSVGHTLSSSILQIAALTSITKDESVLTHLNELNSRLSEGMNSIRNSLQNIHDETIDLNLKLKELTQSFDFCEIDYIYEIENDFLFKAKYSLIFIIQESLTNIIKHSNATHVTLSITELPNYYKIVIQDNGTSFSNSSTSSGMGIISIYDRVSFLNGTININKDKGYCIYITIPTLKKES